MLTSSRVLSASMRRTAAASSHTTSSAATAVSTAVSTSPFTAGHATAFTPAFAPVFAQRRGFNDAAGLDREKGVYGSKAAEMFENLRDTKDRAEKAWAEEKEAARLKSEEPQFHVSGGQKMKRDSPLGAKEEPLPGSRKAARAHAQKTVDEANEVEIPRTFLYAWVTGISLFTLYMYRMQSNNECYRSSDYTDYEWADAETKEKAEAHVAALEAAKVEDKLRREAREELFPQAPCATIGHA